MATKDAGTNKIDATPRKAHGALRFALHFLEMIVAMLLGMALGEQLYRLAMGALGFTQPRISLPELTALWGAVEMTLPMVAWMRYRGHAWRPTGEMAGAMFLPAFAFVILFETHVVPGTALMPIVHGGMGPAMLAAMLFRRSEYTQSHAHHRPTRGPAAAHGAEANEG